MLTLPGATFVNLFEVEGWSDKKAPRFCPTHAPEKVTLEIHALHAQSCTSLSVTCEVSKKKEDKIEESPAQRRDELATFM